MDAAMDEALEEEVEVAMDHRHPIVSHSSVGPLSTPLLPLPWSTLSSLLPHPRSLKEIESSDSLYYTNVLLKYKFLGLKFSFKYGAMKLSEHGNIFS
jgi:hypothetical protein